MSHLTGCVSCVCKSSILILGMCFPSQVHVLGVCGNCTDESSCLVVPSVDRFLRLSHVQRSNCGRRCSREWLVLKHCERESKLVSSVQPTYRIVELMLVGVAFEGWSIAQSKVPPWAADWCSPKCPRTLCTARIWTSPDSRSSPGTDLMISGSLGSLRSVPPR